MKGWAPGRCKQIGVQTIPRGIWALGFVSMFMDISSEMIHSLLPVFLSSVMGASATAIGILEGTAEATVFSTKIFSGALSDWLGKRKVLALVGYGLAAATKPLFPLATSYGVVFGARIVDRAGKGIREAPRDALIADLVPEPSRGASYGLRQSLDTLGAVSGPLIASFLMWYTSGNFRSVFWAAVGPALLSVGILMRYVREPSSVERSPFAREPAWSLSGFPRSFWFMVAIGAAFTMARSSEAFLVLRAGTLGIQAAYIPLVIVVMNLVYAASAYPFGKLSDRMDRPVLLALSAGTLVIADICLGAAAGATGLVAGVSLWGLSMGLSQGLMSSLIAGLAPRMRRGTAFGIFNLVSGGALLLSSVIAGFLWDHLGPAASFYMNACVASATCLAILPQVWKRSN